MLNEAIVFLIIHRVRATRFCLWHQSYSRTGRCTEPEVRPLFLQKYPKWWPRRPSSFHQPQAIHIRTCKSPRFSTTYPLAVSYNLLYIHYTLTLYNDPLHYIKGPCISTHACRRIIVHFLKYLLLFLHVYTFPTCCNSTVVPYIFSLMSNWPDTPGGWISRKADIHTASDCNLHQSSCESLWYWSC